MGLSNGVLTYPFTKIAANGNGDLQRALETSQMSQSGIFANGKINKWAKFKAFKNNIIYTDRYSDPNSQRLAGLKAQNYGFSNGITSYTGASSLHSAFSPDNEGNVWEYVRPTIGNGILRALDFDGYLTSAASWGLGHYEDAAGNLYINAPFDSYVEIPTSFGNGTLFYFGFSADSSGAASGLLSLSDFSGLSGFFNFYEWYFGVALISKNGTYTNDYFYVCDEQISGNISKYGTITSNVANGSYYVVPILAQAHTNNTWVGASGFPTRVVLLDGYYGEATKSASANAFQFGVSGTPYVDGGVLKVNVAFNNHTGSDITLSRVFTYTQADATNMLNDCYQALVGACRYWVNEKAEQTGGAGVKVDGQVVAVYKQHSTSLTIPITTTSPVVHTFAVTDGLTDAKGNPYDENADVRICILYSGNYLCNNIY